MRVVTTCHKQGWDEYGHKWPEGMKHWPCDDFVFYVEGDYATGVTTKRLDDIPGFAVWKAKHAHYRAPGWEYEVVKYANKVFAAIDALYDYDGVGVWLDADCVTFRDIPKGLIESYVKHHYLACYQRTGYHTETGLWVMNCAHPEHKNFLDFWRRIYFEGLFRDLSWWTDCHTLDAAIRKFSGRIKVNNLSGDYADTMHPQAKSELGQYIDHQKGLRKYTQEGSPENKARAAA